MRARNIKPGLYKDEELSSLPLAARYLFPGLWMMADCKGRLEDRPRVIKVELYPFDDDITVSRVDELLKFLHESDFIIRYKIGDRSYIQIRNFEKHQNPHKQEREKGTSIPDPPSEGKAFSGTSEAVPSETGSGSESDPHAIGLQSEVVPVSTGVTRDDSGFLIPDSGFPAKRKSDDPPQESLSEPLEEFRDVFIGEFPSDTWRAFMEHVNTPEKLDAFRKNTPLWMKTKKYRTGYGKDAKAYARSGVWLRPPQQELLETEERAEYVYTPPPAGNVMTISRMRAEQEARRKRIEAEQ